MKSIFTLIFIFIIVITVQPARAQEKILYLSKDKKWHIITTATISAGLAEVYYQFSGKDVPLKKRQNRALIVGIGSAVLIGAGKEAYDYYSGRGVCSYQDFWADLAGAAIGGIVVKISFGVRNNRRIIDIDDSYNPDLVRAD